MEDSKPARYIAEFVGTFLLVFTVGCNVIGGSAVWGVTSIACVLMVSIYAFGASSGANFNPAVSLALGVSGKLAWMEVIIYIAVQLVAGIVAGFSYYALEGKTFNLQPKPTFGLYEVAMAEILYTFMLCFVVLNCAASTRNSPNQFFGLAIGFSVIAGGYGAGAISGGCFNPAVAMGIDVASIGIGFGWGLVYFGCEMVGAALAGFLFQRVRPEDFGGISVSPTSVGGHQQKLLSEFIGTFMLVTTVGLNVLGNSPAGAWSIAASLMCMIYSLGGVSGAHFNPAVTIAIVASHPFQNRKKIAMEVAGMYIGVQCVAGILAGFLVRSMHKGPMLLGPSGGYGWGAVAVAEIVFTFVLCFVVLSVATVESPLKQYFGLAIGSCVTVGGIAIGNISGGSLNPAVSLGISATGFFMYEGLNCLIYTLFELIGAGLAAGAFYLTRPSEYKQQF